MDIETVPRRGLDDMVEAEVAKRTERRLNRVEVIRQRLSP